MKTKIVKVLGTLQITVQDVRDGSELWMDAEPGWYAVELSADDGGEFTVVQNSIGQFDSEAKVEKFLDQAVDSLL